MVAIIVFSCLSEDRSTFPSGTINNLKNLLSKGKIVCETMTNKLIGDIEPTSLETLHTMFQTLNVGNEEINKQPVPENIDSCTEDVALFTPEFTITRPPITTQNYELAGAIMGKIKMSEPTDNLTDSRVKLISGHAVAIVRKVNEMYVHFGYLDNDCPLVKLEGFVEDNKCNLPNTYIVDPIGCAAYKLDISTLFSTKNIGLMESDKEIIDFMEENKMKMWEELPNKIRQRYLYYHMELQNIISLESKALREENFYVNLLHHTTWVYKRKQEQISGFHEDFRGGGNSGPSRSWLVSALLCITFASSLIRY